MLSKTNHTFRVARFAPTLAVHVLREHDRALAERFGSETGDEVDKFSGLAWNVGPGGAPVLEGVDWFAGTVGQAYDVGDHVAVIIDVLTNVGNHGRADAQQLPSSALATVTAGHAP